MRFTLELIHDITNSFDFFFINSDIVESPSNTGSKVYAERQFKGFYWSFQNMAIYCRS